MAKNGYLGECEYMKPEKARLKRAANPPKSGMHGSPSQYLKMRGTHKASYTAVPRPPGRK